MSAYTQAITNEGEKRHHDKRCRSVQALDESMVILHQNKINHKCQRSTMICQGRMGHIIYLQLNSNLAMIDANKSAHNANE